MAERMRSSPPWPGIAIAQRIVGSEPIVDSEMLEDHFASEPSSPTVEGQDDFSYFLDPKSVTICEQTQYWQGIKLGEGSYAKVFRGMYQGKSCAVKVFKEGVLKSEVHQKGLDKKYIMSTCTLKNPNIVHIYGLWIDPYKGRHVLSIVMELCDCSLHEYIKGHKGKGIPQEIKLKILHDITNGMIYLHSFKGMVHGNLRSSNVLLQNTKPSGNSANMPPVVAKLASVDLTQRIDPKRHVHYTNNFADEDYLPPEVFGEGSVAYRKQACLTFSVDVFCFGPLVIELACMEYPKPTARIVHKKKKWLIVNEIERRKKHLDRCKFLDCMYTDLIVKRCMAQNPEERGSFLELQAIIEGFQRQMADRPHQVLLEEQQATIFELRMEKDKDSKTLFEAQVLKEEVEEIKKADLMEKLNEKSKELLESNSAKKAINKLYQENQKQRQDLEEERNANQKEKMHLEGQIESLNHKLEITTKSLEERTLECAELKSKLEETEDYADLLKEKEKEAVQLKVKLKEEGDKLLQLQRNGNEMRGEIGKMREELAVQKTFSEQKERSWESLQNEHDHLVNTLKKMEREQEERSIQLQKQKEHFQAKEEEFKYKIEEITRELESNLSSFKGEEKELDMKVTKRERLIRQKEQEIDDLKRSKEALSGEVEEKERELVELKKKLEEEVARSQENQKRLKQAEATRNEMARLAGTLQSEVSELTRVLNDQEANASEKKKELQEELKMAKEEKLRLAEQMKEEERVKLELRNKLGQQKKKWESGVLKADKLTERIHFLDTRLKGETVRSAELQYKADHLYQKSDSLKKSNAKLEKENFDLRITKALFDLHQEECEKHRMSSLATQESTDTALSKLEEENQSLFTRCDCLQVENVRMCEVEKKLRASNNELQETLESLKTKVRELIQENISLKNEHKRCHDHNTRLERDLEGSKAEVVRLERKEQSLVTRRDELEREKRKLMKENEGLKLSFESTHSEAKSTESEVDLEEFKRQEERKGRVEQMQTTIGRLKELTETRSSSSDDEDQGTGSFKPTT